MEPVYCPNGHPNRPGTRICAVCRALVAPPSTPDKPPASKTPPRPLTPSRPAPPPLAVAADPAPEPQVAAPPQKGSRLWLWVLFVLLAVLVAIAALLASLYPVNRTAERQPTPVIEALPTVANTAPAAIIDPTATLNPESTAPPTNAASPSAVPTITPLPAIVGIVVTPTFAFEPGANLLQNGEFTDDWVNGWVRESDGRAGVVEVRPLEDEPGTTVLHLDKTGAGVTRIGQRVVLTTPIEGLVFRARVRQSGTWSTEAEGRSAVMLQYEDAAGEPLGASVWLDGSVETTNLWGNAPLPSPGPTVAVRFIDQGWQAIETDLSREVLEELPGVDAGAVRQITIFLLLLSSDTCGDQACAAALDAVGLSLSAGIP